jgi:translation elongation factor EF-G
MLLDVIFCQAAIRRATVAQKFIPVYMGSAFKNKVVAAIICSLPESSCLFFVSFANDYKNDC